MSGWVAGAGVGSTKAGVGLSKALAWAVSQVLSGAVRLGGEISSDAWRRWASLVARAMSVFCMAVWMAGSVTVLM